jgi:2-oxoglutarate dehydrogenase E2 component (dihydrolipoamide succinyltransferase)
MDPENEQQEFSALAAARASESMEPAPEDGASSSKPRALPEPPSEDAESVVAAEHGPSVVETRAGLAAEPESEPDPATTLSPAVRRLVRQYDLDITGIHGTGPSGRIRVGDVMGVLGARTDATARLEAAARGARSDREFPDADEAAGEKQRASAAPPAAAAAPPPGASTAAPPASAMQPMTTVFECDVSRVMSHRKQLRHSGADVLLTSYYLAGCAEALRAVPELAAIGADAAAAPRFGVLLASGEGEIHRTLVEASAAADASLDDRLRAFDRALRASADDDLGGAGLVIHHYGMSGSLLATPLPLGASQAASVGIGRVRRAIVIKSSDGEEGPRVAAMCYVTVTFRPDLIPLQRANRFLAHVVRALEHWPV